jgi:hypothetical protein
MPDELPSENDSIEPVTWPMCVQVGRLLSGEVKQRLSSGSPPDDQDDPPMVARPCPTSAAQAGASCSGGWIAPDGRFYATRYNEHIRIASALRATGSGPKDPWDVADPWLKVMSDGEVLFSVYLTQGQLDTVGDMLRAAPDCSYRSQLLESLRGLHELEDKPFRRAASGSRFAAAGG